MVLLALCGVLAAAVTGVGNHPLAERLHCDRSHGSQLAPAAAFLRAHRRPGVVPLITIDIGINDINRCADLMQPARCLLAGEGAIRANLARDSGAGEPGADLLAHLVLLTVSDRPQHPSGQQRLSGDRTDVRARDRHALSA